MTIIYCPVCGKNIKYSSTCQRCGYDEKTDYEVYPTLDKIKSDIKSVEHKRQEYENQKLESLFESYLIQHVYPLIKTSTNIIEKSDANETYNDYIEKNVLSTEKTEDQSDVTIKRNNLGIGETICFGSYKQDAKGKEKKPIEWIILDKKDDYLLLISKYVLECKPYNNKNKSITWEKCSLRAWLNSDFIADAFNSEEASRIVETRVIAYRNPEYSINPGNATEDKVFLLSIQDVKKHVYSSIIRKCKPTEYVKKNNVYKIKNENCWWWLRSRGGRGNFAAGVSSDGNVDYYGYSVNSVGSDDFHRGRFYRDPYGVRPALWITL